MDLFDFSWTKTLHYIAISVPNLPKVLQRRSQLPKCTASSFPLHVLIIKTKEELK
ncbi:uncharacterized protein G2W53_032925 [Senna tora]|uniref:Uncharacterized protein n=1 Tax=Senna tora TaxID=362788 RepID=A0A834T8N1_9FABA|nr:uncharacterized protein G2W53_032925 [Senna tora]